MRVSILCFLMIAWPVIAVGAGPEGENPGLSPPARDGQIPRTRWEHLAESALWTRSALSSLKQHGKALVDSVPADIGEWCPAYPAASPERRRAFWVGFLSALAEHESTYRPRAVGGAGRWYGLLQILPATARGHGCRAGSGPALMNGPANLSCAIRIMARTVLRDGVVSRGRRGVAADWGPLVSAVKRREMMAWVKKQSYCKPLSATRPRARPVTVLASRRLDAVRPRPRPVTAPVSARP